ncbi:MAG TPA: hypothetical protein VFX86_03725, partial [Candidatus Saccharimonadales bacterium]|nr:hypothetical protein [Candidatus Saccharimonadales bacterium]
VRDTLVVRDWFNMAASRLTYQAKYDEVTKYKTGRIFGLNWSEVEERWLRYAHLLMDDDTESSSLVCINYNRWFSEPDYRVELAARYGLPNSEATLDTVPHYGPGSSFNQLNMNGNGRTMNVLRRWENLDPGLAERYKRIINNPVLAEINYQLFGIDQEEVLASV